MLTPQEVSQHAFAKASFGGYNMAMVDEFLDALTEDYTALYKENQVLKSKMKVLVDKVEEYRATDDSMRKAFLVAQKSAEDIVAKAEAERVTLVQQAESEARAKVSGVRQELEAEQRRLTAAQAATAAYVAQVRELCKRELAYIDSLPQLTPPATPAPAESIAAQEIESAVQKLVEEPVQEESVDLDKDLEELKSGSPEGDGGLYAELLELNLGHKAEGEKPHPALDDPEEHEEDEDFSETTRRFDHLQFGKDYEIR
ncbi:DivIVA domain protein [uncultured Eubacteriales bacterium]|uniref:DivIVA domain protein n=1 Tax=uncultured Eubacteriales bacterium TaxID=172733 RepID=A0A212KIR0_9FIRM|nr:DivIVA domain protein [uncultured Eubacteriales bacterium]